MGNQPSVTIGQQSAERKRLLATMTAKQLELCRRDYGEHLATCAKLETPASSFDVFLIEWLECERGKNRFPALPSSTGEDSRDGFQHQSYERLYEGKRGFE